MERLTLEQQSKLNINFDITVKIMSLENSNFEVRVLNYKNKIVSDLKNAIYIKKGIDKAEQRLIYLGKVLIDSQKLSEINISEGSTVHLVKSNATTNSNNNNLSNNITNSNFDITTSLLTSIFNPHPQGNSLNSISNINSMTNMLNGLRSANNTLGDLLNMINSFDNTSVLARPNAETFLHLIHTRAPFSKEKSSEVLTQNILNIKNLINTGINIEKKGKNNHTVKEVYEFDKIQYRVGQWVDVCDSFNMWYESQIQKIEDNRAYVKMITGLENFNTIYSINNGGNHRCEWVNLTSKKILPFRTKTVQSPFSLFMSPCINSINRINNNNNNNTANSIINNNSSTNINTTNTSLFGVNFLNNNNNSSNQESLVFAFNNNKEERLEQLNEIIEFIDILRPKIMSLVHEKESLLAKKERLRNFSNTDYYEDLNNRHSYVQIDNKTVSLEEEVGIRERQVFLVTARLVPLMDRIGRFLVDYSNFLFNFNYDKFNRNFQLFRENIDEYITENRNSNPNYDIFDKKVKLNLFEDLVNVPCMRIPGEVAENSALLRPRIIIQTTGSSINSNSSNNNATSLNNNNNTITNTNNVSNNDISRRQRLEITRSYICINSNSSSNKLFKNEDIKFSIVNRFEITNNGKKQMSNKEIQTNPINTLISAKEYLIKESKEIKQPLKFNFSGIGSLKDSINKIKTNCTTLNSNNLNISSNNKSAYLNCTKNTFYEKNIKEKYEDTCSTDNMGNTIKESNRNLTSNKDLNNNSHNSVLVKKDSSHSRPSLSMKKESIKLEQTKQLVSSVASLIQDNYESKNTKEVLKKESFSTTKFKDNNKINSQHTNISTNRGNNFNIKNTNKNSTKINSINSSNTNLSNIFKKDIVIKKKSTAIKLPKLQLN